jgi:hypothetical protein
LMPRYKTLNGDLDINVDGLRVRAADDGWFSASPGSRLEQALLAGGAVSDTPPTGGAGLPDGNLGDVFKSGFSLTVPALASKADAAELAAKANVSELAAKADAVALQTEAQRLIVGSASGPIDTAKQHNPRTIGASTALTFSAQPALADTFFGCALQNTAATDVTVTLPASFSLRQQSPITSFVLPANGRCSLLWHWDGAAYLLHGEPVRQPFQATFALFGASTAGDYDMILNLARPVFITSIAGRCAAGADAATLKIGGVATQAALTLGASARTSTYAPVVAVAAGSSVSIALSGGGTKTTVTLLGYYAP